MTPEDRPTMKGSTVPRPLYPAATPETAARRRELAPDIHSAWDRFSSAVFAAGALDELTKQLIAVAVAHVTQCPYCIAGHTRLARIKGASDEQVMETVWVAAEMRAGGAFAHSTIALGVLGDLSDHEHSSSRPADGAGVHRPVTM